MYCTAVVLSFSVVFAVDAAVVVIFRFLKRSPYVFQRVVYRFLSSIFLSPCLAKGLQEAPPPRVGKHEAVYGWERASGAVGLKKMKDY